jgi:hypothetical protein
MKKTLALALCLTLLPTFAFAYTFGNTGTVKERILGITILSPGAVVTLYDLTFGGWVVSAPTAIDGTYSVRQMNRFPVNKLFLTQRWTLVAHGGRTNAVSEAGPFSWVFNVTGKTETKIIPQNFICVFFF